MILVTGGSGFLGGHLVRELSRRGERVRALYKTRKPGGDMASLPGVEWMQADLLDIFDVEVAMKDVVEVYHCAAIVSFDPRRREEMLHFNPESTANIVNEAVEQGIRKLVYVSSVAALGRSGHMNKETDEEQEWGESGYNSAYGISKYLAENEVWRGVGEGLCAAIVCPSLILGPGDWSSGSPQIMTVVDKEFPFYTGGVNGWVGVADVVHVMVLLMASDIEGERFIVSEGNHAYREIFTMMANALGKKPPRIRATPAMTGIIWRASALWSIMTGTNPVITRETASTAHSISLYNNGKLLQALSGFRYTPIEQCVADMAAAFKLAHMG